MKYVVLALAVFFGGCATFDAPKEVKIPVPVPCKAEEPAIPAYRFTPPYDSIFDATRDLMGDRELSLAYEIEQRAALKSCK